ncbi:uncharacterized protein [Nicotiana sylvestris]|uniref:uncharacterized protein n=1 Tax=Nicotiana sylvestris TaxID=4096 RepID=UPI00388C9A86
MPNVDALTRDDDEIRSTMWDESRSAVLTKCMYFPDKARLIRAVKIYSIRECREMIVSESTMEVYKVVCHRDFMGCHWMLRASKKKSGLWKVGKFISTHRCEMDTFNENNFNLDVDLISLVLIPYLEVSIRFKIKECITAVHQEYMAALQHFNPDTVVEWRRERSPDRPKYIFNYVFWSFKAAIDGFVHCRPIISIDSTHVYGKYDIKLLIAVAIDANRQIFPLAFAICVNKSEETWTLFLNHLKQHVVKQRSVVQIHQAHGSDSPIDPRAYTWLMGHELHMWTLHADGGRRWGALTTNVSESFNGLLKFARGLPVTAMIRMTFK